MRIVQIIDSLEVGGAERMAVNYANSLSEVIAFSGLVATRKEGSLKQQLGNQVGYLFLGKRRSLDIPAALRLKKYCKANQVQFLQPHSSSYFIAVLVKLLYPKIKIVWHDHNGLSEFLGSEKWVPLKIASLFFSGIAVVNYKLKNWAIKELYCKKVIYLPNFTNLEAGADQQTFLKGTAGKRILCMANLRDQKNHFFLIEIAQKLKTTHPEWTFHLVGKDFEDDYSKRLGQTISDKKLENHVFLYGTCNDTGHILTQTDVAILTSKSEGLPVALLEYGLFKKPVAVTDVGEMPLIVENHKNGFVIPSGNAVLFHEALVKLIDSPELRSKLGEALFRTVMENNSQDAVIGHYLNWLKTL